MTNNDNQNSKTNLIIIIIAGVTLVLIIAIAVLAGVYQYNNPVKPDPITPKPQTCEETKICPKEPQHPNFTPSFTRPTQPNNNPTSYPIQKSEWGQKYKDLVSNTEKNKFTAIYLDQSGLDNKYINKEILDKPAISYAWNDFKNIKSENFAVYYYGDLEFDKQAVKEINISQSWSKTKIYIDEFLVFDSENNSNKFLYEFTPGKHTIEIEYENNWHTVEFAVNIIDPIVPTSLDTAAGFINADLESYNLYYVGLYESSDRLLVTKLNVIQSEKPIVLLLSSYSSIEWQLIGDGVSKVKYILINSYNPGSLVSTNNQDIKIFHVNEIVDEYSILPNCRNDPRGSVYCENKGLVDFNSTIKRIFGKNIDGVSGKYEANSLSVPENYTTADDWVKFEFESQNLLKNGSKVDR